MRVWCVCVSAACAALAQDNVERTKAGGGLPRIELLAISPAKAHRRFSLSLPLLPPVLSAPKWVMRLDMLRNYKKKLFSGLTFFL